MVCFAVLICCGSCSASDGKLKAASEGTYEINVPGSEDVRNEKIVVDTVTGKETAKIYGQIYYCDTNSTYSFSLQTVTMTQYEGALWYANVSCTDNVKRVVFCVRKGTGQMGSFSVGADVCGSGGSISFPVFDKYTSINYLYYAGYSYLK